jgi:hypothetical protein
MEPKEPRKDRERPDRGAPEPRAGEGDLKERTREERVPHDIPGGAQRGQEQGFNPPHAEADTIEAAGGFDRNLGVSPAGEDIMDAAERPDADEVFAPGEIVPVAQGMSPQRMGVTPTRVEQITPGEDLRGVADEGPSLSTEPFEGRIAGESPDYARRDLTPETTRNLSGGGSDHPTDMAYLGPERRVRQEDWKRWRVDDRREHTFTYGDRHTL